MPPSQFSHYPTPGFRLFSTSPNADSGGVRSFYLFSFSFAWGVGFGLLFGASNGVMTIVRGTAPAELFGQRRVGSLLGRLARPAFAAKAIAPVTFAALLAHGVTQGEAAGGLALVAFLGFL